MAKKLLRPQARAFGSNIDGRSIGSITIYRSWDDINELSSTSYSIFQWMNLKFMRVTAPKIRFGRLPVEKKRVKCNRYIETNKSRLRKQIEFQLQTHFEIYNNFPDNEGMNKSFYVLTLNLVM